VPSCLTPNGGFASRAEGPVAELLVGTTQGVVHFARTSDGSYHETRRSLVGHHISSIAWDVEHDLLFAGAHGAGGLFRSADGGLTWTEKMVGMSHHHVFTVAVQPREAGVFLYAGVEPPGLYRSKDLGDTWEILPALTDVPGTDKWTFPPPPHTAHAKNVAWHPADPDTLYVCVEQGALLKTTDGGATFHELASYETEADKWYRDTHRIVIAPSDPNRLYMTTGEGLYLSRDAGSSWEHLQTRFDRVGYPDALFVDPTDEDVVYIGGAGDSPATWEQGKVGSANAAVIRSNDGGHSWKELDAGLPKPIHGNIEAVAFHTYAGGLQLFAGTAIGDVFLSDDGGDNWTMLATGLPPISKVHHYRWFLSTEERLRIEDLARAGR
jgi:photosystem II stability/assembly factor-like uncharacterized protein